MDQNREEVERLIGSAKAKTFCEDFDEQLDIAEQLYGERLQFNFSEKTLDRLLEAETVYPQEVKARVKEIVLTQRRKYQYLVKGML